MSSKRGLSLVELMVALGLGGLVLLVLSQVLDLGSSTSTGIAARARVDTDFTAASSSVQRSMTSSFRFMAVAPGGGGQVRFLVPLFDTCRDMSACPGAVSLLYAVPQRRQDEAWRPSAVLPVGANFEALFEVTDQADMKKYGLREGDLLTIFNAPFAPLFRLLADPSVGTRKLAADPPAGRPYLVLSLAPYTVPAAYISQPANRGGANFAALQGPGAGVLAMRLRSAGPLPPQAAAGLGWSFGSRDCAATNVAIECTGSEHPSVPIEGPQSVQIAAAFRRPLFATGPCASAQTLFDLRSDAATASISCADAGATGDWARFPSVTPTPVPQVVHPLEHAGDIDTSFFSLVKFDLITTLRFRLLLSRPFPEREIGPKNKTREVVFHVQFP
jgi:hypothetical protein